MRYSQSLGFALALLVVAFFVACEDQEEKPLSQMDKRLVSRKYADTVRKLTPVYDSLCEVKRPELVTSLADSIFEVRKADLERQRKRFNQ